MEPMSITILKIFADNEDVTVEAKATAQHAVIHIVAEFNAVDVERGEMEHIARNEVLRYLDIT